MLQGPFHLRTLHATTLCLCLVLLGCPTAPIREPPKATGAPELFPSAWLHGEPVRLEDLERTVVILDFFGSWYPSSREVIQLLKDLSARYSDRGLVILSCTLEDPILIEPLIRETSIPYRVFVDDGGKTAHSLDVRTLPTVLVFGPDLELVYRGHPLRARFAERVRQAVEALEPDD